MNRKRITLVALPAVVLGLAGAAAATPGRAAHTAGAPAAQGRGAERTLVRAVVDAGTPNAGTVPARDLQLVDAPGPPEPRAQSLPTMGGQVDFVKLDPIAPI